MCCTKVLYGIIHVKLIFDIKVTKDMVVNGFNVFTQWLKGGRQYDQPDERYV